MRNSPLHHSLLSVTTIAASLAPSPWSIVCGSLAALGAIGAFAAFVAIVILEDR